MAQDKRSKLVGVEEEQQRMRLAHGEELSVLFADNGSIASQTLAAYSDVLEEALLDVAVECHREAKTRTGPYTGGQTVPQKRKAPAQPAIRYNVDLFGQAHPASATELVCCMKCGRKVAAGKFAYHLEKCLGKGRSAGRTAAARRNAGAPT